jgi:hypothetical protein
MVTEYRWATLALVWTCQLLVGWAVILSWAVHFFEVPKFVSSVRKRVFMNPSLCQRLFQPK